MSGATTFNLAATRSTVGGPAADFDVHFLTQMTPWQSGAAEVGTPYANGGGNEDGDIPAGANFAIIILCSGPPGESFVFTTS